MRLINADDLKKAVPKARCDAFQNCGSCSCLDEDQVKELIDNAPTVEQFRWIPVSERLPENAERLGELCPTYRVMTPWGESQGWYNPDDGGWWVLVWYKYGTNEEPDFENGSIPGMRFETEQGKLVTHWMPKSQPPQEEK